MRDIHGSKLAALLFLSSITTFAVEHPRDWRVFEMTSRLAVAALETQPELVRPITDPARPGERFALVLVHERAVKPLAELSCRVARRCGGFVDISSESRAHSNPLVRRQRFLRPGAGLPPIQKKEPIAQALAEIRPENIEKFVKAYSTSFRRRDADTAEGKAAAEWLRNQWAQLARDAGRADIVVEALDLNSTRYQQPNVRVTIPGADPAAPIVIIGGHLDSAGYGPTAPGADDNASGLAVITEAYRMMLAQRIHPKSTVQLFGYAAEEVGLVGSRKAAEQYKNAGVRVKAAMQMDMTAYPGKGRRMTFITDNVDRELSLWTEQLYGTYVGAAIARSQCGYACSDHASWDRYGYASVFPCEASLDDSNPRIHSSRDIWDEQLDANHAAQFAKLAYAFAVELSEAQ